MFRLDVVVFCFFFSFLFLVLFYFLLFVECLFSRLFSFFCSAFSFLFFKLVFCFVSLRFVFRFCLLLCSLFLCVFFVFVLLFLVVLCFHFFFLNHHFYFLPCRRAVITGIAPSTRRKYACASIFVVHSVSPPSPLFVDFHRHASEENPWKQRLKVTKRYFASKAARLKSHKSNSLFRMHSSLLIMNASWP